MININDTLSTLGKNLQGSEIRRLFAISMQPNIISFAGGLPDPGSFPSDKAAETISALLRKNGKLLLQYGPSRGTKEGIEAAMHRMQLRNIRVSMDEVIMTSGAQQAIDIATKVLADPGDILLMEKPTFVGALGVFRNSGAILKGIPMDEHGIIPEQLEHIVHTIKKNGTKIKFLYTIPNFQNPTGLSLSLERRKKILQIAEEHDFFILEDDPYGELWFEGGMESVCPIKSLDTSNRVLYMGSFSKILSPGIRLGWITAPQELIERFDMAKQMMDVCNSPLIQAVAAEFCRSGFFETHTQRLRDIYRSRCKAMLHALRHHMPEGVSWTEPSGGFYIWITLPGAIDAFAMLEKALQNDVAYVCGAAFHPDGSGKNTLRVSFCHETEDVIEEGIKRLGNTIKKMISH